MINAITHVNANEKLGHCFPHKFDTIRSSWCKLFFWLGQALLLPENSVKPLELGAMRVKVSLLVPVSVSGGSRNSDCMEGRTGSWGRRGSRGLVNGFPVCLVYWAFSGLFCLFSSEGEMQSITFINKNVTFCTRVSGSCLYSKGTEKSGADLPYFGHEPGLNGLISWPEQPGASQPSGLELSPSHWNCTFPVKLLPSTGCCFPYHLILTASRFPLEKTAATEGCLCASWSRLLVFRLEKDRPGGFYSSWYTPPSSSQAG